MLWIIPIAGKGARTQTLGEFKPFIDINGRKIISWFLYSVRQNIKNKDEFIFITLVKFNKKYNFSKEIQRIFKENHLKNKFKIILSKNHLQGTSLTIYLTKHLINKNIPIVIAYPDQFIKFELPRNVNKKFCYLPVYANFGNKAGYVIVKDGFISKIVEKNNVSNLANTGIYIISSAKDLFKAIEEQFKYDKKVNGEFYISEALNHLIKKGYKLIPLEVKAKYNLGNLKEILYFRKNSKNNKLVIL